MRTLPAGRRLAYAWLLGVAWTAGLLYALSHFLAVPLRPPAILAVAALPVVAGTMSRLRRRPSAPRPRRRFRLWEWLLVAVGAMVSLAVLGEALSNPVLDWDGLDDLGRSSPLRAPGGDGRSHGADPESW